MYISKNVRHNRRLLNQPSNIPYYFHAGVSESMAAFLQAEELAQQSLSESQMDQALGGGGVQPYPQHTTGAPAGSKYYQKPPGRAQSSSAISMEEQRLMQSLERLNERLKCES